jgi:hypothetical protein
LPDYALPFDSTALLNANIECKKPILDEEKENDFMSINMKRNIVEMLNLIYSYLLTSICILLTVVISIFMVLKIVNTKIGQIMNK